MARRSRGNIRVARDAAFEGDYQVSVARGRGGIEGDGAADRRDARPTSNHCDSRRGLGALFPVIMSWAGQHGVVPPDGDMRRTWRPRKLKQRDDDLLSHGRR